MLRRWLPWMAMAVIVAVALTAGVQRDGGPRSNQDRIDHLARQFKCLVCSGESVFESRSDFANQLRKSIADNVSTGLTDKQIKSNVVAAYGEQVLLVPEANGANLLLWVTPIVAGLLALGGVSLAFARWRRLGSARPSEADRELVAAAMAGTGGPDNIP
jgi:cytochrome c-type biogenesis protein CcmH